MLQTISVKLVKISNLNTHASVQCLNKSCPWKPWNYLCIWSWSWQAAVVFLMTFISLELPHTPSVISLISHLSSYHKYHNNKKHLQQQHTYILRQMCGWKGRWHVIIILESSGLTELTERVLLIIIMKNVLWLISLTRIITRLINTRSITWCVWIFLSDLVIKMLCLFSWDIHFEITC